MTEKSFRFTKTAIDQLPVPTVTEAGSAGYVLYWDKQISGFGISIRPSGMRTFFLAYRNRQRRSRRLTIGRYGRLTLDQAQRIARQQNGSIWAGDDPTEDKKRDRSAKTLDELFQIYIMKHVVPNCSEHAVRSSTKVRTIISATLRSKFINEIKPADVRNCLNQFCNQRGNFNLVRTYISAAWNWAQRFGFGLIEENARNPVHGIENLPSTPRARAITAAEYEGVFKAIEALISERRNDPARLLACLFVIETGCRPIEAVRLRRDKVFRDRDVAELLEHKTFKRTGKPKRFFLTAPLLDILDRAGALHTLRGIDSEFVFPRRSQQKASNWLAKTWDSVRHRAGVDIELRQFRSGYINLADDIGMSEDLIAEITQHASTPTVRRHYLVTNDKRAIANANTVSERMDQFRRRARARSA